MATKLFYKGIEQKIITNLSKAKKDVKIAVAWFTNPLLFDVLLELTEKKISIEIILCDDKMNFTNAKVDFQSLIDLGVSIRVSKFPYLMHNKFCLIDSRVLINGSYNWTLRAEQFNFENILISTDKELINDFQNYFDEMVDKTMKIISIPKTAFRNYFSHKEIELELELEKTDNILLEDIENEGNAVYTEKILQSIDKAELLYLNGEHSKCIEFCTEQILKHPQIAEFHLSLASSYWRTNKVEKLVVSAQNAIDINNELYDAYNLLGIAYSKTAGREQFSIKQFNICLNEFPNEHTFLMNRAQAYLLLESDINIPKNIKDEYTAKANLDLENIIKIVSSRTEEKQTYDALYARALSYGLLNKKRLAANDVDLALEKYNHISDKFKVDRNTYFEMKDLQRELKRGNTNR